MVNTRRMESIGSTPDISTRHRTRATVKVEPESQSSSVNESDSEDSNAEESSWNTAGKSKIIEEKSSALSQRSRVLRSRFAHSERKFASRPVRSTQLRTSHKHISLNERRSIRVYSTRDMHDDSDMYNGNDSEEEIYSRRCRRNRSRHAEHLKSRLTRIQRRTALSLRPISRKCYTDPRSPLHFNSDSDGNQVRRSKRKRVQFNTASWLTDDQMHKVGYPNLNVGYSEEDSRDAHTLENEMDRPRRATRNDFHSHENEMEMDRPRRATRTELYTQENEMEMDRPRRVTRNDLNKRRDVKNAKYLFDYETNEVSSRRRKPVTSEMHDRELRSRRESNDKENKEENSNGIYNGRLRSIKTETTKETEDQLSSDEINEAANKSAEPSENDVIGGKPVSETTVTNKQPSSDSDEDLPEQPRTRPLRRRKIIPQENFSPRRTRNGKDMDSSSSESEEERKPYSLRDRQPRPKPAPTTMQKSVLKAQIRNHRRFTRRRNVPSSSSDSSTSDGDLVRHSKPPKGKNTHLINEKLKSGADGGKIVPIRPETLDSNIRFSTIGGLDSHIQCLKEMILLPMMYPEVFKQFQIQPPRGVLFHGPPGTGKTLIARALANECSIGSKKVSFFMRKGADLLSKWIGESEKQLRLLFEQAAQMKPSIIFFDELDGLAPVRSSRQDQVHASIVSTLLALMDGLDNRGEVIVIGATNRIDAIDPALRRPGRFDRELFFPLPSRKEREEILNVHVSQWTQPPNQQLLSYLAEHAVGYCGSDLRALCSEAVIQGFRRSYPQVYNSEHRLLLNPENVKVEKVDFMRAKSLLVPASQRVTQGLGRKLLPILEPLLQEHFQKACQVLEQSFPHGTNLALSKVKLSANVRPAQLLLTGDGPEHGQTLHLAPALLYKMEHIHAYLLDLASLFQETGRSAEEACIQVINEARRNVPSIIYIPSIDTWWNLVNETVHAILISQISQMDPNIPILFLATADTTFDNLPDPLQNMFSSYRKEVFEIGTPNEKSRKSFFKSLLLTNSLRPPRSHRSRPKTPPQLPRAPTPPPTPLSEEQAKRLYEVEEHTLRELRIFLRDMCKKLANNKLFFMFTKPVDTEEVPDYTTIIKQPMDLETMMMKVDFHRYECAKDFLNDIELICQNALEYNPARTSADKQIRHRACSLRDYAYTLIKTEMDTDFEDKCQTIASKRRDRKACVTKYLPAYINTPDENTARINMEVEQQESKPDVDKNENATTSSIRSSPQRKRKTNIRRLFNCRKRRRIVADTTSGAGPSSEQKNKADESSADESKDSKENGDVVDQSTNGLNSSTEFDASHTTPVKESIAPLSINCDTKPNKVGITSPLQSPRRRLSDLMSPSELLDDVLDFDDVEQALNETEDESVQSKKLVDCSQQELERVLNEAVTATDGDSLLTLLDLYNQLNRIIRKYSRTHVRTKLPAELSKEVARFKKNSNSSVFEDNLNKSP